MAKKDTRKKVVIGITITLLTIFALFIVINSGVNFRPLSVGVISVSDVQVKDNGAKILVTVTPQGMDDLQVFFSPSELNRQLESQGYKATSSSVLKVKYVESSKKFFFTDNERNSIKKLRTIDTGNYYGFGTSKSSIIAYCKDRGNPNTVSAYFTDTGIFEISNVICVESFNEGYVNSFNTGLGSDGFSVEFDLDGEKAIVTGDQQFISMANGRALITWQGSLLGINNLGAPNYDVFHLQNQWYLVDKNAYASVSSAHSNFISCMDSTNWLGTRPNTNDYNSCKSSYLNILNSNIVSEDSSYVSQVSNADSISFSQGILFVDLKQPTFKPVFTIELDAEKVGLIRLAGDPKIEQCIEGQDFEVAGTKSAGAIIKNDGNSEGFFDFRITCNNQDMSGHADGLNFDAGESRIVNFQIYGGNSQETTNYGNCLLKVTDRASQKSVDCSYNMEIDYKSGISDCIGTETKCSGDLVSLFKCEDGEWVRKECTGNETCGYKNDVAQCLDEEGPVVSGYCSDCDDYAKSLVFGKIFKSQNCLKKTFQGTFFCFFSILKMFAVPFFFILSLLFGFKFINQLMKGEYKGLTWALAIIIGGLVGMLTYFAFYVGLIIFIVIMIARFAIGFIPGLNLVKKIR